MAFTTSDKKHKKLTIHTTPVGEAKWAHIYKPQTEWKPEGEYNVTLSFTPEEAEPVIAAIDAGILASVGVAKTAYPKKKVVAAKDKPYKDEVDREDNETGRIAIKFKSRAKGVREDKSEWAFCLPIFDAKGTPLSLKAEMWSGSKIKVAYDIRPYYNPKDTAAGVSLGLKAVQVIDLVMGSAGGHSGDYGFGVEEGYEAPTTEVDKVATSSDDEGVTGGEDF